MVYYRRRAFGEGLCTGECWVLGGSGLCATSAGRWVAVRSTLLAWKSLTRWSSNLQ